MATYRRWMQCVVIILMINCCISEVVTCSKAEDCQCTRNEPCQLKCIGKDFCKGGVTLKCGAGQSCQLLCSGEQACTDSTLVPNGASSISIACSGGKACSGAAVFECAADAPCSLVCPSGNCDELSVAVSGASSFKCIGSGCPLSAPPPYTSPSPTPSPTKVPTQTPSAAPSRSPSTDMPSRTPSKSPSNFPSRLPSYSPSRSPSTMPTRSPSHLPTRSPSNVPTRGPTHYPSAVPSSSPSSRPTSTPSSQPSRTPSSKPTPIPSIMPTWTPSNYPSNGPTPYPSTLPSSHPSSSPTSVPSASPSTVPTRGPSSTSSAPSVTPSSQPSRSPTGSTRAPTTNPSPEPTPRPTPDPTPKPSALPSSQPSGSPSSSPTRRPSSSPSASPSHAPTASGHPTKSPTADTTQPSYSPSDVPTRAPSRNPSAAPSRTPSHAPSTSPTRSPSTSPTTMEPTYSPSAKLTPRPSDVPTRNPSASPSDQPTSSTTRAPSNHPSATPSKTPSSVPSASPTRSPSIRLTDTPSTNPTPTPSSIPTTAPSDVTSSRPTYSPSASPSRMPTVSLITSTAPTRSPSDSPTVHSSDYHSSSPTIRPSLGLSSTTEIISEVHNSTYPPILDVVVPSSDDDTDDVSAAQTAVLCIAGLSLLCVLVSAIIAIVSPCGYRGVIKSQCRDEAVPKLIAQEPHLMSQEPRHFLDLLTFALICSALTFALIISFALSPTEEDLLIAASVSYDTLVFICNVYFILRLHSAFRNNEIFTKGRPRVCHCCCTAKLTCLQLFALICLCALAVVAFINDIMHSMSLVHNAWLSPVNHIALLLCFLQQIGKTRVRSESQNLMSLGRESLIKQDSHQKRLVEKGAARHFVTKMTVLGAIVWFHVDLIRVVVFLNDDVFVGTVLRCYGALVMICCMNLAFEFADPCLRWCCSLRSDAPCSVKKFKLLLSRWCCCCRSVKKRSDEDTAMEMSPQDRALREQQKAHEERLMNRVKSGGAEWLINQRTPKTTSSSAGTDPRESVTETVTVTTKLDTSDTSGQEHVNPIGQVALARGARGGQSLRTVHEDYDPESTPEIERQISNPSLQESDGQGCGGLPPAVRSPSDLIPESTSEPASADSASRFVLNSVRMIDLM